MGVGKSGGCKLPEQQSAKFNAVGSLVLKGLSQFVGLFPLYKHLRLLQGKVETGLFEELAVPNCFLG